jgi:membrane-associated phospholipid phosphatase
MITYGAVSLNNSTLKKWDRQIKTGLYDKQYIRPTRLDNYLQFVPSTVAFGMKAAGVKSVHKLQDMAIIYVISNLLETGVVYTLKTVSSRTRPDGTANNSFPSGHTATSFVAAEFLHQEYGDKSVWISVGGYTVATLVGAGRIFNNRHWFSDVVAGSGIGVLSVKMVYWAYPSLQKIFYKKEAKSLKPFVFPSYNNNAFCLNFACEF